MIRKVYSIILLIFIVGTTLQAEDKPILTVLDFSVSNISAGDMNAIVSFLSSAIFETGQYQVIDKGQRDVILDELQFSNSGCSDESCQLEIGKLLAAEYIVVGDISKVGSRFILNTRILETESSRTINAARGLYADLDELLDNMDTLARDLCSVEGDEEPVVATGEVSEEAASEPVSPAEDILTGAESGGEERELSGGRRIAALTTLIGGAAAAITGGYLIWNALDYKDTKVDPAYFSAYLDEEPDYGGLTPDDYFDQKYAEYTDTLDTFQVKSITAISITAAGVIGLGVSALLYTLPEKEKEPAVSFHIYPGIQTVSMSVRITQ